jgi:hypothetical protein
VALLNLWDFGRFNVLIAKLRKQGLSIFLNGVLRRKTQLTASALGWIVAGA